VSQLILADNSNNFFSILVVFGDVLVKKKKSHGDELIKTLQYNETVTAKFIFM
jgi:hypothetical protein